MASASGKETFCNNYVHILKQESIPVGCVPSVGKLYMLQWPPPDVILRRGPQVNKFEQVSSCGHQMSVADGMGPGPGLMSEEAGSGAKGDTHD